METYFGVIAKVLDPDLYTVEVDIPGEQERLKAFPFRGEVDEPRVGDVVFLREFDPIYHSYYLYEKLKENDFIGIRARGKKIWMKEDFIQIGIIPPDANNSAGAKSFPDTVAGEWYDDQSGADKTPDCTSWVKIDKEGNIDIEMEGSGHMHIMKDHKVEIDGNVDIKVGGNAKIEVSGNVDAKIDGNLDAKVAGTTELDSPNVTVTGGIFNMTGQSSTDMNGPFNPIKICPVTGSPHCGSVVNGT